MTEQKDSAVLREIGYKLANFRRKLALAIGVKKIKQEHFGAMFGDYSERQLTSYENGNVEIPARLLYLIWKSGNSIDALFSEADINEPQELARELYKRTQQGGQRDEMSLMDTAIDALGQRQAISRNPKTDVPRGTKKSQTKIPSNVSEGGITKGSRRKKY